MDEQENRSKKRITVFEIIAVTIGIIAILWFCLVVYENYRVSKDKKTLICFNSVKEVEDDDEYSITCYGLLYKYREYFYIDNDQMSARELTMFFKDFERKTKN